MLRPRSISHVEGCLLQLKAAINATPGQSAQFSPEQQISVSNSPKYRASVKTLAAMFTYAMAEDHRANLLRFLRMAVATWARPDAIFDMSADQWYSEARVLDLNPPDRRQTAKRRPMIPVARQFAPWLDELEGSWMPVTLIRSTWEKMRIAVKLPDKHGEAGEKLIRRSMSTLARRRMGEANWIQGQMMLGHVESHISDIYAIIDPANMGLALKVTEEIIDEIEFLAPGAFRRADAALPIKLSVVKGGKNG